jgi:putative ABC transport system permease protein
MPALFHSFVRRTRRLLIRDPRFTVTALVTLGLCIGANVTIFSVVDGVLLRPLPFPDADRLVAIFNTYPAAHVLRDESSITNYYERRGQIPAFAALAIHRSGTAVVGPAGATALEQVEWISADFLETLGVAPALGRGFTEEETAPRADDLVLLTDTFWRRELEADPAVIGRDIRVDGRRRTVLGVLPPGYRFLSSKAQLYLPLSSTPEDRVPERRHSGSAARMIARLATGVSLEEAQAQIDANNARVTAAAPSTDAAQMADAGFRTLVVPLHEDHVAAVRPVLLLMQLGVLVLFLIGAVNLMNLLLVRASAREKELSIRQALGATGRHVIGEVLAETTALGLAGSGLGLALGVAGTRLVSALGGGRLPLGARIAIDGRVALAAVAGALVVGLGIGLPAAWYSLRRGTVEALGSGSRGGTTSRTVQRIRQGFIVAQVSLAFVLLSAAGVFGVSLRHAISVSPGFRQDHVLSGRILLPSSAYPGTGERLDFVERLTTALQGEPGIAAVGIASNVPFSGISTKSAATVVGPKLAAGEMPRGIYSYSVGGDYFDAMGVTLLEGRFLNAADSRREPRVCVVDADFASFHWPRGSALGQRLFQGGHGADSSDTSEAFTVVGVVAPVKQPALTDPTAQGAVYYPYGYFAENRIFVVARTEMAPESLTSASALTGALRRIDPDLPADDVESMARRVDDSLLGRRSPALLLGLFASLSLLLTAVGTYGVVSYAVAERRREIGVRLALGARPEQVRNQFLALGLRLLAAGTTAGIAGAWLSGRALQTMLFQVPALHLPTVASTAGLLFAIILAACLIPSRRAARTSPLEALTE